MAARRLPAGANMEAPAPDLGAVFVLVLPLPFELEPPFVGALVELALLPELVALLLPLPLPLPLPLLLPLPLPLHSAWSSAE